MENWQIDPHSHSNLSDGMYPSSQREQQAKMAGLDGYGATDHDLRVTSPITEGMPVRLNGMEVSTGVGHVLVFAPGGIALTRLPLGRSLVETVRRAHGEGLKVILPHVGFGIPPGSIPPSEISRLYDGGLSVEGIETRHPNFSKRHEQQAETLAILYNLARIGTSDDHTGNIGRKFVTIFPRETHDVEGDFWQALANRQTAPGVATGDLVITPVGKLLKRHVEAVFVGLPAKVQSTPFFARTIIQFLYAELKARLTELH